MSYLPMAACYAHKMAQLLIQITPRNIRWTIPTPIPFVHVRTTFVEVSHTMGVYKGRRFRQKTNGGYGLPVIDKIGDNHLLHVGADLAWFRVGEPVFAVANGVVRLSTGPDPSRLNQRNQAKPNGLWLAWGNIVVIEHRLTDESHVTTIYGHLDTKRHVQTGDIVVAGQQIGTIGRKTPRIEDRSVARTPCAPSRIRVPSVTDTSRRLGCSVASKSLGQRVRPLSTTLS